MKEYFKNQWNEKLETPTKFYFDTLIKSWEQTTTKSNLNNQTQIYTETDGTNEFVS